VKPDVFQGVNRSKANTLDEAVDLYKFEFPVGLKDLTYNYNGQTMLSPFHRQTVALDNGDPMGVVGLRYTVVPYRDAFAPAVELIKGGARIVGGALLNNRASAMLVMVAPGTIKLSEGDEIVNRFVMTSSHDGSSKIEVRMTPYRQKNGTALTVDATRPLSFKHTPRVSARMGQARKIYKRVNDSWDTFTNAVGRMVLVKIDDKEARDLVTAVLGDSDSTRMENIKEDILTVFKHGTACQLPKCKGTLFGLVQAFAEWADHGRTVRKSSKRDEVSAGINARLIADSAAKKQRAWATALWFMKGGKLAGGALDAQ